jgi:ribonucleotide monophosphatase NagD (HAD superfamily)
MYAIFDIDGCCIDCTHRLPLIDTDYDAFVAAWRQDRPIAAGVAVYSSLMKAGIRGVFITARPVSQADATRAQLDQIFPGFKYDLIMAPSQQVNHGDFKMASLKKFLANRGHSLSTVLVCFDDNTDVIETYRKAGLVAYQTAEGWK